MRGRLRLGVRARSLPTSDEVSRQECRAGRGRWQSLRQKGWGALPRLDVRTRTCGSIVPPGKLTRMRSIGFYAPSRATVAEAEGCQEI